MSKKQTKAVVHVGMASRTATFDVSKTILDGPSKGHFVIVLQDKDERLLAPKQVTMAPRKGHL